MNYDDMTRIPLK